MTHHEPTHALSDVLDELEQSVEGEEILVEDVVEALGRRSFAALMLAFSLVSTSPASAIPGITAVVAALVFVLVAQMIVGRKSVWLPRFVTRRRLSTKTLCKGIRWLRKPVRFVERFLKPRLTWLFHRPWMWLPLTLVMGLTLFMPFMEIVPTSGSIASAIIALFAASLLTRDGVLALISLALLSILPVGIYLWL
ncbi:exopolysaccharide biosynthesis protein [Thalassorhabdomicrobium marinisediminis]|uniref:Exopolysaccharide biosynthesis protein exod n=1 Tax=Thalassorhabdomicrobium marinisediminis TaxID=2170577 RepID=A0A2T7G174_9RHOB|nr:exopolysaccharide biosynthesis protein [Thalassorhabdomicrobium marinisediminis]PVA08157.1 exopolysaccharide biosynthesis protein exod [Thalassorhabdomicrobium marinisediminis]